MMQKRSHLFSLSSYLILMYILFGCSAHVAQVCEEGQDCLRDQRCIAKRCTLPPKANNRPPTAVISGKKRVKVGEVIQLSGRNSSDVDKDFITFRWVLKNKPKNSKAVLSQNAQIHTSWLVDVEGSYTIQLTVTDALGSTNTLETEIKTNQAPIVEAGGEQLVLLNTRVKLDASQSLDLDKDPLRFTWQLLQRPEGSTSQLEKEDAAVTYFKADRIGVYIVRIRVHDTYEYSEKTLSVRVVHPDSITPSLIRVNPWKASTRSIVDVSLYGKNFIQGAHVRLNNKKVQQSRYHSSSLITATLDLKDIPEGAHSILVHNPEGKATEPLLFQVTAVEAPKLASISPNIGTTGQRVQITAKGTGFVQGAQIVFRGNALQTQYKKDTELVTTLNLQNISPGRYQVYVTNGDNKKSKPLFFTVEAVLPKPHITRVYLSARGYIDKKYTFLRINTRNIASTFKVFIDGKEYTKQKKLTHRSGGHSYIVLPDFETHGWTIGQHSVYVVSIDKGQSHKSNTLSFYLADPYIPKLYSLRFYLKNQSVVRGKTQTIYSRLSIRGQSLHLSARIFINKREYKGKVNFISPQEIQLPFFSTESFSEGNHSIYIIQNPKGTPHKSNTLTFRLEDIRIPYIHRVESSDVRTQQLFTQRIYTYLKIRGRHFYPGIRVIFDGVVLQNTTHLDNDSTLYVYQFDTRKLLEGKHTLILYNTDKGKQYRSSLYTLQLIDGRTPHITRVLYTPSSQLFENEIYKAQILCSNLHKNAQVLIDGIIYTGPTSNNQTTAITLTQFSTKGLKIGRHTLQVRNTLDGKQYDSNNYTFYIRKRPPPLIYTVTPNIVSHPNQPRVIELRGLNLTSSSVVHLEGKPVPTKYISFRELHFTIDKTTPIGTLKVSVVQADGQTAVGTRTLELTILPQVGPSLLYAAPSELHTSLEPLALQQRNIALTGLGMEKGADVYINGKKEGTVYTAQSLSSTARINSLAIEKKGAYSIYIQNPDGKKSNTAWINVLGNGRPEILSVSPYVVSINTRPFYIRVSGRDFSNNSTLWVNGKAHSTTFTSTYNGQISSGSLRAHVDPIPLGSPDVYTIEVRNTDGKKSKEFRITSAKHPLQLSTIYPNVDYVETDKVYTMSITGKNFTATSKVYFDGAVLPTQLVNAFTLKATWSPTHVKGGSYHKWSVRDGKVSSRTHGIYIKKKLSITRMNPPFFKVGTSYPRVGFQIDTRGSLSGPQLEIFGKKYTLTRASLNTPISVPSNAKVGVNIGKLIDGKGQIISTFGFHVVSP